MISPFNMALRPVFSKSKSKDLLFLEKNIDFKWHPGFSKTQSIKNILSLHENANQIISGEILEVSSHSPNFRKKLSAFNLNSNTTSKQ